MSLSERILDWSKGLPPWQSDLLRRLTGGPLTDDDEREVLRMLVGTASAPTPRALDRAPLPDGNSQSDPVELREIRDVQNINLLADGQVLCFKPGINVIFGATGAGKSGYGRLLHRLSRPTEDIEVLRNAFDVNADGKRQTAVLQIAAGAELREIPIDLAAEPDHALSAITVFDAVRAPQWVSKPSVVARLPEPLGLLRRLAETQEALRQRLKERIGELQADLPALEIDPSGSAAHLLQTVTAETDLQELERLAILNDDERAEAKTLDAALAALRFEDSRERENAARARARSAENIATELERASEKLSDERIEEIDDLRERLDDAIEAERSLAADAFSTEALPGTGHDAWRAMWQAARRFVESEGGTFPGQQPGDACPLCQRKLTIKARAQMAKLEEFVGSDLRRSVVALTEDLRGAVDGLPDFRSTEALVEASLSGATDRALAAATAAISALSTRAELARQKARGASADSDPPPKITSVMAIRAYADEQLAAADTQAALRDEAAQQKLLDRRTALRGREELGSLLPAISKRVGGLRKVARCRRAADELRTAKVSAQLRKLQEDAITNRLCGAIVEELTAMNLLAEDIDVAGKAKSGRTAIEFGLRGSGNARVGAILSEGEQRACALALFLAESAAGSRRSAMVLDDPAALLDRERCRHVAHRLVQEAQKRQVIVFTHDLAFVQMLQKSAAEANQELHCQALRRAYGRAGILDEPPISSDAIAAS